MPKHEVKCLSYCALSDEDMFYFLSNAELLKFIRDNFSGSLAQDERALFEKILAKDRTRQLCRTPLRDLLEDGPESRYNRYRGQVIEGVRRCSERLMSSASLDPGKIRLVISTTTVAGMCPPVSSVVINHLKLPSSTEAIDLSHMGCSALLWGIELAGRLLKSGEAALVIGAEITSFMADYRGAAESMLAATVFGDGVAGVLVAHADSSLPAKLNFGRASGSIVASERGLECIQYVGGTVSPRIRLEEDIGGVAAQGIESALRALVRDEYVTPWQKIQYLLTRRTPDWGKAVDYFVVHTAGSKVLKTVAAAVKATEAQFRHNFVAFERFGNLSSTSFLYSLKCLEESSAGLKPRSRILFLSYGSGFMTRAAAATA